MRISEEVRIHFDRSVKEIGHWLNAWTTAQDDRELWKVPHKKQLIDLYESTMIDERLSCAIMNRKSKVLGEVFQLLTARGKVDEKKTALLNASWFRSPQNGFLSHALDALFYGYSLVGFEKMKPDGTVQECALIERRNVIPERNMVLRQPYDMYGLDYTSEEFDGRYICIRSADLGLLLKASPLVIYKRAMKSYWAEHAEVYQVPMVAVKTNTDAPEELDEISRRIADAGRGRTIALPFQVSDIEVQTMSEASAFSIYKELVDNCDAGILYLVQGQTGTSEEKAYVGAARAHQDTADEIADNDREFIESLVNDQLLPMLAKLGGPYAGIDKLTFKYQVNKKAPLTERIQLYDMLVRAGYTFTPEVIKEEFGVEVLPQANTQGQQQQNGNFSQAQQAANLTAQVDRLYASHGHAQHMANVAQEDLTPFQDIIEKLAGRIHSGEKIELDDALVRLTASRLLSGMEAEGIKDYPDVYKSLRENVYVFSGFKTYQQLREVSDMVLGPDGKPRPWREFAGMVDARNQQYNLYWLNAERNHATQGSRMAANWGRMTDGEDPVLEYSAVGDGRTRQEHRAWDGIKRRASDDFWKTYYPPNGWNCRCDVRVSESDELPLPEQLPPVDAPMFKGNIAIDGVLFPEQHPYFNASKAIVNKVVEMAKKMAKSSKEPSLTTIDSHINNLTGNDYVQEAMDVINSIHGVSAEMSIFGKIDVYEKIMPDANGKYLHHLNGNPASKIVLTPERSHNNKIFTLWHEVGHWIDHMGITSPQGFCTYQKRKPKEFIAIMESIESSHQVAMIKYNLSYYKSIQRQQPSSQIQEFVEYLEYLLLPHEMFARAYAQYILSKTTYPTDVLKDSVLAQWESKSDFDAIGNKFDQLFKKKRWMIKN